MIATTTDLDNWHNEKLGLFLGCFDIFEYKA
jgi:hypothetical protein